jgi:hypothetical protein
MISDEAVVIQAVPREEVEGLPLDALLRMVAGGSWIAWGVPWRKSGSLQGLAGDPVLEESFFAPSQRPLFLLVRFGRSCSPSGVVDPHPAFCSSLTRAFCVRLLRLI